MIDSLSIAVPSYKQCLINRKRFYNRHSAIFLPWSSAFGVGYGDSFWSVPGILRWRILKKTHRFFTSNDFLEKSVIYLLCYNEYAIFLILLTKSTRNPNAQLAIFFRRWQIVDWDVLRWSTDSHVLWRRLQYTNSLSASSSDLAMSNDALAINAELFLAVSVVFFVIVKLSQNYISNMRNHRINYDALEWLMNAMSNPVICCCV